MLLSIPHQEVLRSRRIKVAEYPPPFFSLSCLQGVAKKKERENLFFLQPCLPLILKMPTFGKRSFQEKNRLIKGSPS